MKRKIMILTAFLSFVMLFTACDMNIGGLMGKERNGANNNSNQITESIVSDTVDSLTQNGTIDKERAKEIALNHAGVNAENITGYKVELDRDYGGLYYEIEFYSAGYEYEYEINAETGEIVSSQKEIID